MNDKMTLVNLEALQKLVEQADEDHEKEINYYKEVLRDIRHYAESECITECDFHFCKGVSEETTCVIYKIKNKIDEVLTSNDR